MADNHHRVRQELDELGYYQLLSHESTPLVDKLLADLKTTTQSLQKYMKIAQRAIEERDSLQLGADPYKCDNARLVTQCNDLHAAQLQNNEQHEKVQKDLNRRFELLKSEHSTCLSEQDKLRKQIQALQQELLECSERGLNLHKSKSRTGKSSSVTGRPSQDKLCKAGKNLEISSAMALADQKISNLNKEVRKLKEQNLELADTNEILECQCKNRDKEISRLNKLLEGGRPLEALNRDCCCKKAREDDNTPQDQINRLTQEKSSLEDQLKESIAAQHEAMKRALHLAERNKMLEKEMKDIDHLALAVEAECNSTVKSNNEKVRRLQCRLHNTVVQLQNLERDNAKVRQEKQVLSADLEAVTAEKRHLQAVLETSLDEKKRLTDKINNFTVIEHDLNMEIDRLMQLSASQKRRIAELENSLISEKGRPLEPTSDSLLRQYSRQSQTGFADQPKTKPFSTQTDLEPIYECPDADESLEDSPISVKSKMKKKAPTKQRKKGSPQRKTPTTPFQVPDNTPNDMVQDKQGCRFCKGCCDSCGSSRHLKELLDKELEYKEQQAARCVENLKSEKDYYMKEYHKLMDELKNIPRKLNGNGDLGRKLAEKEQMLASLQHENKILAQEKYSLMSRLETARDHPPDTDREGACLKVNCKRTERERDLLRADLERLEEERDALRQKLKTVTETQAKEVDKLCRCLAETEEQLHQAEQEKRELVQNQGTRRSTINTLEEQCDNLKDQLRTTQSELNHQRAIYSQLKTLQEQTDRTLSDTQAQLMQAEAEVLASRDNLKRKDDDRGTAKREIDMLRDDLQVMRSQLAQIDREKDELLAALDDKTEKLAATETDLKAKDKLVASLEATINDLNRKISLTADETASQDHLIRSSQSEIAKLRQDLESASRIKDSALGENRRLQDDLAAVTCDCRDARHELDLYRRQVDDLKTQLQHYVAEIKRVEDLISNKEVERNNLLDQFRSLSHEANILESSNHTLETEATQTKVQLSVALEHTTDLERKLNNQESMIRSYERQIAELTSQIASLEVQMKQNGRMCDQSEAELTNMREYCLKLDTENQKMKRLLREHDDQRTQADRSVEQLRTERETLQRAIAKDKHSVESMEKLLNDAKQESTDLRLLNQDLQEEVQRMNTKVQELQSRFYRYSCLCVDSQTRNGPPYNNNNHNNKRQISSLTKDFTGGRAKSNCCNICSLPNQKVPYRRSQADDVCCDYKSNFCDGKGVSESESSLDSSHPTAVLCCPGCIRFTKNGNDDSKIPQSMTQPHKGSL